jgi:RHH-type rel operon transcriptional repressor/antitoxin RelB
MSQQTCIRLPDDVHDRLKALASKTGRSTAYYIREAIEEYLADLEDIYLAEKALEDIRAGKVKTISLDEMSQRLGLDD